MASFNKRSEQIMHIAMCSVKDETKSQWQGKKGFSNTAKDGRKIIQPRLLTALGGQFRAVVITT